MLTLLERRRALRYIGVTQSNQFYPEMRARVHAMFVKDKWWSHFKENPSLPFALHLSLLLFMAGVLIYFFNVNHATFGAVAWWITYTSMEHTAFTVMPIFQRDALYYAPLFSFLFELYLWLLHYVSRVCSWIKPGNHLYRSIRRHIYNLIQQYREGLVGNKAKWVEEAALEPSWGVDITILEHILLVLNDDDELKRFFDAIPGFCNSELVKKPLHHLITTKLRQAMDDFLDRTFSSHLVPESVRNDRLITCLNVVHSALEPWELPEMLGNFFNGRRNEALKSVEIGHSLSRWGHGADVEKIIANITVSAQNRDDRWRILVQEVFGVPDDVFGDHLAHGDSALLAILIYVAREDFCDGRWNPGVLESLSRFDLHNTDAELQYEFCTLWNEIVEKAREETNEGGKIVAAQILAEIHHIFAALHQLEGTNLAQIRSPTPFGHDDSWTYRSCHITSHYPEFTAYNPATTSPTILPLVNQPLLDASRDLVTENATVGHAGISATSGISDLVRSSNSGSRPALQNAEQAGVIPHSSVVGPLPTPIPTPAPGSPNSNVLPSSVGSALMQTDHVHHSPRAPPLTSSIIPLSAVPPDATVSVQVQYTEARGHGTTGTQRDDRNTHLSIHPEDHCQSPPGGPTGL